MSNIQSVGAPAYPQMPAGAQPMYQTQAAAPVTGPTYATDAYRARLQQQAPPVAAAAAPAPKDDYKPINTTDIMLGGAGAVGGFFLAGMVGLSGPIGALILGIALLGLSAGIRAIKHKSDQKQQQTQMQAVHPGFQQAQPQYQNYYAPQQGMPQQPQQYAYPQQAAAPMPQQNMQYAQSYQQYQPRPGQPAQAPMPAQGAYPGAYPQQQSMWDKFLSWL